MSSVYKRVTPAAWHAPKIMLSQCDRLNRPDRFIAMSNAKAVGSARATTAMGGSEGASGPVTSKEPAPVSADDEASREQSCNCIKRQELEKKSSGTEEALGDVTHDVADGVASHEFAMVAEL
jgi:hypothetical protein